MPVVCSAGGAKRSPPGQRDGVRNEGRTQFPRVPEVWNDIDSPERGTIGNRE